MFEEAKKNSPLVPVLNSQEFDKKIRKSFFEFLSRSKNLIFRPKKYVSCKRYLVIPSKNTKVVSGTKNGVFRSIQNKLLH
jgi:hypothetical protein